MHLCSHTHCTNLHSLKTSSPFGRTHKPPPLPRSVSHSHASQPLLIFPPPPMRFPPLFLGGGGHHHPCCLSSKSRGFGSEAVKEGGRDPREGCDGISEKVRQCKSVASQERRVHRMVSPFFLDFQLGVLFFPKTIFSQDWGAFKS